MRLELNMLMIEIRLSRYSLIELLKRTSQNGICLRHVTVILFKRLPSKKLKSLTAICSNTWDQEREEYPNQFLPRLLIIKPCIKTLHRKEKNGKRQKLWAILISNIEVLQCQIGSNGKSIILLNGTQIISYLVFWTKLNLF